MILGSVCKYLYKDSLIFAFRFKKHPAARGNIQETPLMLMIYEACGIKADFTKLNHPLSIA